jgi:hypothetical protein
MSQKGRPSTEEGGPIRVHVQLRTELVALHRSNARLANVCFPPIADISG